MKDEDDGEGQDGKKASVEETGAPGDDDNGVIGEGDDGGDEEDHGVA